MVVFGGSSTASYNTYILSEEGELEQDYSDDPLIPALMCQASFTVQSEKVFAFGGKKVEGEWELEMRVFDGKKWSLSDSVFH